MNPFLLLVDILAVITPVFGMIAIGVGLRQLKIIDEQFIITASNLVFNASMPALLFFSISQADFSTAFQPKIVFFFIAASLLGFAASTWFSRLRLPRHQQATFIVSASRGNSGIISLSLAISHFGELGLTLGGILAGTAAVITNMGTIFVYSIYNQQGKIKLWPVLIANLKSPFFIAVVCGGLASYFGLHMPEWFLKTGTYFSSLSLPLALICVGGSLTISAFKHSSKIAFGVSGFKLCIIPLFGCSIAYFGLGFSTTELGMLFLFLGSPTAAAVFAIAKASNGDGELASASIVLSTLLSLGTIVIGLFLIELLTAAH